MPNPPTEIRSVFLCDDVRREDNGKLLVIGAYSHNIAVIQMPATLLLTLVFITWTNKPVEKHPLAVHAIFNGKKIFEQSGHYSVTEPGQDMFVTRNMVLVAESPGELEIKTKLGKGRWKSITSIALTVSD